MEIDNIINYCLKKEFVEECLPFDKDTLVFKVKGKMFLLVSLETLPLQINVKCQPEKAIELREQYPDILPGYHMNKKHWNTIICSHALSDKQILNWIDDSYHLVVKSLPQKTQAEFKFLK
ncbi:MAG: MmcQ/YjbR family DNA-binding protein [Bacteroidia bacterium]|nr:MmcQ/YjbR family DNA-binding protein [Bacteroidia bacterium]